LEWLDNNSSATLSKKAFVVLHQGQTDDFYEKNRRIDVFVQNEKLMLLLMSFLHN